jgi:hypothetical protein
MPVPLNRRQFSCEIFGDKILDGHEFGLGIGRLEQEALEYLIGDAFAIVVERPTRLSVGHQMRSLDMDIESFNR